MVEGKEKEKVMEVKVEEVAAAAAMGVEVWEVAGCTLPGGPVEEEEAAVTVAAETAAVEQEVGSVAAKAEGLGAGVMEVVREAAREAAVREAAVRALARPRRRNTKR